MGIAVESELLRALLVEKLGLIAAEVGDSPRTETREGELLPMNRMDRFIRELHRLSDHVAVVPGEENSDDYADGVEGEVEAGIRMGIRASQLGLESVVKAVDFPEERTDAGGFVRYFVCSLQEALGRVEEAFRKSA